MAHLLGVLEEDLKMSLTASVIEVRGERLIKKLTKGQVTKASGALIKATYGTLFVYNVR